MTPAQIESKAEELRHTEITMSNYKDIINDVFVLIRELAAQNATLTTQVAALEKPPSSQRSDR